MNRDVSRGAEDLVPPEAATPRANGETDMKSKQEHALHDLNQTLHKPRVYSGDQPFPNPARKGRWTGAFRIYSRRERRIGGSSCSGAA